MDPLKLDHSDTTDIDDILVCFNGKEQDFVYLCRVEHLFFRTLVDDILKNISDKTEAYLYNLVVNSLEAFWSLLVLL